MIELLDSGLKNDNVPETFELRHSIDDQLFPCRFIKILPLQSWGSSFNFSIWFVKLSGIDSWDIVKPSLDWFLEFQKREAVRLCLKYLRKQDYKDAFSVLSRVSGIQLEDPMLTELHKILVEESDFNGAEQLVCQSVNSGLFSAYISKQEYRAIWRPLQSTGPQPGMRGGHQMCIDPHSETIFLLGGWDGNQDLSDLWAYHVPSKQWRLISNDTEAQGGPSARSCHKMCLDPKRRQIFTLGRYLDCQYRVPENLKSDFYVYDIESNQWTLITDDTAALGGPQLIFDHQMCIDVTLRTIYVFGGRVLNVSVNGITTTEAIASSEPVYSGLFSYHVSTNTWRNLCPDSPIQPDPNSTPTLRSRVSHSMLFHPIYRKLFIFAGQRNKDYLNDFFSYDVDSGLVEHISDGSKRDASALPAAGFTQRATIDPQLDEIYVLSGLSKDKEKRDDSVQNSFWVYYIKQNEWSCVYRNENAEEQYWSKMQHLEPCPRFAHQLVYDHVNKVHYLFGGNPGKASSPKLRLDDFWRLTLYRPTYPQLLQRFRFLIRKYRFQELASSDSLQALHYLQTSLSDIIDHEDPEQTKEFQKLASVIFQESDCCRGQSSAHEDMQTRCFQQRCQLFEELCAFFPANMTQPQADLLDLVPM
ncbi:muskelin [Nilaparvata lugens]|uniref:muskelin n=1 Tax=Nilaparvata lugens TaxID=108931 RepID=UPI00193E7CCB|nr:muskelin [Nilaparvata lugens]